MRIAPADLLDAIEADASLLERANAGDDAGVAALLNTQSTACNAPRPLTVTTVFQLLSEASLARLGLHPAVAAIRDDLTKPDAGERLLHWAHILAARGNPNDPNSVGTITLDERDAIIETVRTPVQTPCTPGEAIGGLGYVVQNVDVSVALEPLRVDQAIASYLRLEWPAVNVYIPADRAALAGLSQDFIDGTKARHEDTILGVEPDRRAAAIARVASVDRVLAQRLTDEAAGDDAKRASAQADKDAAQSSSGA